MVQSLARRKMPMKAYRQRGVYERHLRTIRCSNISWSKVQWHCYKQTFSVTYFVGDELGVRSRWCRD